MMKKRFALKSIVRQPRGLRWSNTVKARTLLSYVAFLTAPLLYAQVNCPTPTSTTSVPMVCQYPYSGDVLATIAYGGNIPADAKTQSLYMSLHTAGLQITSPINASIATQLAQLPMPSAAAGTVTLTLPGEDTGTPFNNLGPLLTDRPDTFRKKDFFLSFAYQHFNFTQIDGLSLSSFILGQKVTGVTLQPNGNVQAITGDFYGSLQSKINFQMDQYIGILTYGLTRSTDVTIAVPVNSVSMSVTSGQYRGYIYSTSGTYTLLAEPGLTTQVNNVTSGSASGVGDVTLNVKQMLFGQEGSVGRYAGAVGGQFRFPTGDANNYLGSGSFGANFYGIVEYRRSFHGRIIKGAAPHVKVGYQWNGQSQIMDIANKPHLNLPGGLDYAFGSDFGLSRTLSFAVDGVGHQYVNAPSVSNASITLPVPTNQQSPTPNPSTLVTSNTGNNTYTTFNFSGGFKWMLPKTREHFLLYANVMVPINNVGLHSDPVPLVGIAYKLK
jgi:hypothetical protein